MLKWTDSILIILIEFNSGGGSNCNEVRILQTIISCSMRAIRLLLDIPVTKSRLCHEDEADAPASQ
jgi:hypothetical protein